MKRFRGFFLALLTVVSAVPAAAQDEGTPPQRPPVAAHVAVVGSRLDEPPATSTVRVITREEIERMAARSLPELLRSLPGLDVRRRGVEGIQADIGIRGGDYNGTLILVDGEPVNDPETNHLSADVDVPVDAIERIEVLYGGGSSLYGSDAVGGAINIVTRGAAIGRARGQVETRWAHGSRSLDTGTARVAVAAGDDLGVAFDIGRSESSGFRDDTEFATQSARLTIRWDAAPGPVTLALGYAGRRYGAYAFYGTRFPEQQETTRTRTARLAADLALSGWTLSPSLSIRAHHDDYVLDRANPSFYENLHDADRSAARLTGRRAFLGGSLAIGAEAGRETIRSTNLGAHGRDHGALFFEYGHPFDPARPALGGATVGLRADTYEGFGSRLSPSLALAFSPAAALRLRGSLSTSFRVPTFLDLYYSDPQNQGNPNLRPERAVNVEAGGAFDAGPLTADAVFFYRHAVDLIDYVRSSPTERYQARNVRSADVSGIEATLELNRARTATGRLHRLALQATYVFTDLAALSAAADGATEGKYVLDPLHVKWDLIAAGTLPFEVDASSRLTYLARPSFADGVWLWEARLGRQLLEGKILELYVEGENLGGVRYEDRPGVPLPGRTLLGGFHLTW